MKCSDCGFDKNPESAHFCVGCGRRLVAVRETRIEGTQSVGQVAESGRATAFQVEKMPGNVTMNVVQLALSPEMMAKLAAVSTTVQPSSARGAAASAGVAARSGKPDKSQKKDRESVHDVI